MDCDNDHGPFDLEVSTDEEHAEEALFLQNVFVEGFCAFKERITINAAPGINLIVAPNNCGKTSFLGALELMAQLPVVGTSPVTYRESDLLPDHPSDLISLFQPRAVVGVGGFAFWTLTKDSNRGVLANCVVSSSIPNKAVVVSGLSSRTRNSHADDAWQNLVKLWDQVEDAVNEVLEMEGHISRCRTRGK